MTLRRKWESEKSDKTHHNLHIPGHSSIANFVYQMSHDDAPEPHLLEFHHTLLYAPVYQSFYEKFHEIHNDPESNEGYKIAMINDLAYEMSEILKWSEKNKRLARIKELETELAKLKGF